LFSFPVLSGYANQAAKLISISPQNRQQKEDKGKVNQNNKC